MNIEIINNVKEWVKVRGDKIKQIQKDTTQKVVRKKNKEHQYDIQLLHKELADLKTRLLEEQQRHANEEIRSQKSHDKILEKKVEVLNRQKEQWENLTREVENHKRLLVDREEEYNRLTSDAKFALNQMGNLVSFMRQLAGTTSGVEDSLTILIEKQEKLKLLSDKKFERSGLKN